MPAHAKKPGGELKTFRTLASFRLHVLARLSERFSEQFYQREFGLSLLECRMIGITGGFGQVSFKRVCEEANLDKSHASRLVDRLIKRRLLLKVSNPSDQRSVMLTLSGAGRECHRALHGCASALAEEWLSVLSAEARRSFQDSLVKLTERIRTMSEDENRQKSRRSRKYTRAKVSPEPAPPLREVIIDRRMARQLYELLGTALGDGNVTAGRHAR
jgi:DNA-binding MarR family transcriptional regulator